MAKMTRLALDDGYDYDANTNVAGISDGATDRSQRGNRTMTYDGLDRLKSTTSPMFSPATYIVCKCLSDYRRRLRAAGLHRSVDDTGTGRVWSV